MYTAQSRFKTTFTNINSKTMNANNTTVSVPLFRVVGSIYVRRIYGIVTTVLGSNHTAAHWRMEDGTNTPAITLATGTTLSSANVGSKIAKQGLAAAALILAQADQVRVNEHATSGMDPECPFDIIQKNGANSDVNYRYTTTNTPTSGVIQFFMDWEPLSADASVTNL
jgi:hypothetical protein